MDEEAIFQAITNLTESVVKLSNNQDKKDRKTTGIFMSIISGLAIIILVGMFGFWRTTEANAIIVQEDILEIKTYTNHNITIIEKTLDINLMHHRIK